MAQPFGRSLLLVAIRVIGFAVSGVAGAYGVSQVALALITPTVSVPSAQYGLIDLPLGIRLIVTSAVLVACSTIVVVALAVGRLAWRVRCHPTFVRETTVAVTVAGAALIAGPSIAQLLAHVGRQLVVEIGSDDTFEFSWFLLPDLSLPAVGIALLLIAGILRHGERLQRDTEGLV